MPLEKFLKNIAANAYRMNTSLMRRSVSIIMVMEDFMRQTNGDIEIAFAQFQNRLVRSIKTLFGNRWDVSRNHRCMAP
jgi:hypothetical protein